MSDRRDPFEVDTPREELARRYDGARPTIAGMPVNWTGADGKVHMQSMIAAPSQHDVQVFSSARAEVCGNCKYFDLERGREELVRQRFAERLVREEQWKLHHLGAAPDEIAICGASIAGGGDKNGLAVTFVSKSCDQFRRKGA